MFTRCAVISTGAHAAVLESGGRSRTDTDHSFRASRLGLYLRAPRGKPRFTLVSDGKPFRRLLLLSKKKVAVHGSLSFQMDLPVTSRKVSCAFSLAEEWAFSLPFHSRSRYTGANLRRSE